MNAENVVRVASTGMEIAYERMGELRAPPVVLVMGLSGQLIHWPDGFCRALIERGLQVIRFDNRDVGRSSRVANGPKPNLMAVVAGDRSSLSYTLSDMAADIVGLLDALSIDSAHFVGASMGGAIVQTVAIDHPSRVRSLTSMMSSTGDYSVGRGDPELVRKVFLAPQPKTREEAVERAVQSAKWVGSPAYESNEDEIRETAGRAYDRGHDPRGTARQAVATYGSGDRTAKLRSLDVPTLVVHGAADRMCEPSGGRATAAAIPNAELALIEGLGHDLPPALWPDFASRIASLVERAESARRAAR